MTSGNLLAYLKAHLSVLPFFLAALNAEETSAYSASDVMPSPRALLPLLRMRSSVR